MFSRSFPRLVTPVCAKLPACVRHSTLPFPNLVLKRCAGGTMSAVINNALSTEASRFKPENDLSVDYWQNRWTNDDVGFHEKNGNKMMQKHFRMIVATRSSLKSVDQLKVFVPLCGKSKDLTFLYEMGCTVVGIEYSAKAIDEFFTENDIEEGDSNTPYRSSKDGRITLGQGDLFSFSGDQTTTKPMPFKKFDVIWDRGSFEAINSGDRPPYLALIKSILADDGFVLIDTKDYNRAEYGGPPLALCTEDLHQLYGKGYKIKFLERKDIIDASPKWRKRGLTQLYELLHVITPITEMQSETISALDNTITPEFWVRQWNNAMGTLWHETDGNKMLWRNFSKLVEQKLPGKKPKDLKVFVPMCGKAKDMYLFYQMGCTVVGVEYAKQPIDEFFTENSLVEEENPKTPFRSSKDGRMIIGHGDLFTFSSDQTAPNRLPFEKFDVIWDRGSFEAINAQDRVKYAKIILPLLADDGLYLINTQVYDLNEFSGPPLAADTEDIKSVFGDEVNITLLEEQEDVDFCKDFGLSNCKTQLNLITFAKCS